VGEPTEGPVIYRLLCSGNTDGVIINDIYAHCSGGPSTRNIFTPSTDADHADHIFSTFICTNIADPRKIHE
jgi:hypothetical protein